MDNKKYIVEESNCYSIGRNYNKIAILSKILKGKEAAIKSEDKEEYKSLLALIRTDSNIKFIN